MDGWMDRERERERERYFIYPEGNSIKHIQKHHAKEHTKFVLLNKTKGAGDGTAQQLTLADALQ